MFKQALITIIWLVVQCSLLVGQSSQHASGGTNTSSAGTVYESIGQVVFYSNQSAAGQILGGVQRPAPQITMGGDTIVCSSDSLAAFEVNASGGRWRVHSEIGTQIDQGGNLNVGNHSSSGLKTDTIEYWFNGFFDSVYVHVKSTPSFSCNPLTLITDITGKVALDASILGANFSSEASNLQSFSISDSSLSCTEGFEQDISVSAYDSSGCITICETTVTLQDTIRPESNCTDADGLILTWAGLSLYPSSISGSSSDNCSGTNLEFSFSSNFMTPSLTFSCRDQLLQADSVMIYMRDASGNVTSCHVGMSFDVPNGEDCGCDWGNLKLKGEIPADDYKAREYITVLGKVTLGDTVLVKAGEYISLLPGFQVTHGSTFFARIDSCGNLPQSMLPGEGADVSSNMGESRFSEAEGAEPLDVLMMRAYPNPFRSWLTVEVTSQEAGLLSLELQDIRGGNIYELLREVYFESGQKELKIDGSKLPAGIYVLRVSRGGMYHTEKIVKIN